MSPPSTEMIRIVLSILMLPALHTAAEPPDPLSPEAAIEMALHSNPDLAAARFVIHQAQARLIQAGLWPNPEWQLGHRTDAPFQNDREYALSTGFRQRLPISGRLTRARAVARVDLALALAELRNAERLLIRDVLARTRQLFLIEERLQANQDLEQIVRQLVQISEQRQAAAEVSLADLNTAKIELQKIGLAQTLLLDRRDQARADLNRLLGRTPGLPLPPLLPAEQEPVLDPQFLTQRTAQAVSLRPDRQLAALALDRASAEIQLARAERWEDWTIGFDYSREREVFPRPIGVRTDDFAGLSLSIPIPLWNRNQGRISEAEANRSRARSELEALELRIATEAQAALQRLQRLRSALEQYRRETLPLSEENVELLQRGYAGGFVPITAVIQAQQQLFELRQSHLDVRAEWFLALTDWEAATASSPFLK